MSRGTESNAPRWGNPTLWLLLVLAFGNIFSAKELRTRRPTKAGVSAMLPEHFFARLWQDPLEIAAEARTAFLARVEDHAKDTGEDEAKVTANLREDSALRLRASVGEHLARNDGEAKVLVLPVAIRTGPYPEARENRIRARYAVVAGLIDQEFVPENPEELDVLFGTWSKQLQTSAIPYQWFEASDGGGPQGRTRYGSALVLWIDEGHMERAPMRFQARLAEDVLKGLRPEALDRIDVSLVGPTSSDELRELLEDARGVGGPAEQSRGFELLGLAGGLDVYSPWSTALLDETLIADNWPLRDTRGGAQDLPRFTPLAVPDAHLRVHRLIGYDEWLADRLAAELSRRVPALMPELRLALGVDDGASVPESAVGATGGAERSGFGPVQSALIAILGGAKFFEDARRETVRVALIAEEDTLYGRAWMDLLQSSWRAHVQAHETAGRGGSFADVQFEAVPYMRGIDGYVVGASSSQSSSAGTAQDKEYPAGHGQIDYLRRLQKEMEQRASEGTYDVIGVLGSDVYDKLVVLEALVPLFPETLFFTTDLDARFGADRHLGYSRNLIIASHYELHRRSGAEAGAESMQTFRDSYQTAQYHAVHAAVGSDFVPSEIDEEEAYLVEVGRTSFVNLGGEVGGVRLSDDEVREAEVEQNPLGFPFVHAGERDRGDAPPAGRASSRKRFGEDLPWRGLLSLFALLALFVWLSPMSAKVRSVWNNATRLQWLLLGGVVLGWAVASIALADRVTGLAEPDEPLALAEGVSVWPAVFLRMGGTAFCLGSILLITIELRRLRWEVRAQYLGIANPSAPLGVGSWAARMRACRKEVTAAHARSGSFKSRLRLWSKAFGRMCAPHRDETFGPPQASDARPWWRSALFSLVGAQLALVAPKPKSFRKLWFQRYETTDRPGPKLLRCTVLAALFMQLLIPVFDWWGRPGSPARGQEALIADKASVLFLAFSLLVLVFVVLDGQWFSARFLRDLIPNDVTWSPRLLREFGGLSEDPDELELALTKARMQVRLASKLTEQTQGFVFYPAVGVCILLLARINLFDRFAWPAALILAFALLLGLLVVCAWTLSVAARDVKADALDDLDEQARTAGVSEGHRRRRIDALGQELDELTRGAFAPFAQHPMIRAALLPAAVLGSGSILGFLTVLQAS